MSPTFPILLFELRYHLRRPTFWLIAAVFFAFGFADIFSKAGAGNAFFFVNSPSQIFQTTIWYSIFSILAASAFVAETFVRDASYRTEALILATPIRKWDYLGTRFLAAFAVTAIAFCAYLPGMILGSAMPGLNPYALGPLRLDAYGASLMLIALPNLWVVSALAFALAARTRSLAVTYAGAIALVMLYLASLLMVGVDVTNYQTYAIWAMADPFGFYAFEAKTFTWTIYQHNTLMPSLGGMLLANRLLWTAIGAIVWVWSYCGYGMTEERLRGRNQQNRRKWIFSRPSYDPPASGTPLGKGGSRGDPNPTNAQAIAPSRELGVPSPNGGLRGALTQYLHRSAFELRSILTGRAFLLLTAFGLVSLVMAAIGSRSFNYANPSTDILIHSANIYLDYILFAIIVVYAAELVWRDRTLRLQPVIDATPISNGVLLLAKLTALFAVVTLNLLLAMAVMVGYQAFSGYSRFDFPLYGQMLFLEHGPYFYLTAVLALVAQVVVRHKYAAMALVVALSLSHIPLDALGLYHNLYRWAATNDIEYSPMNGYGPLFTGHLWYVLYWGLFGTALLLVAYLLWPRGVVSKGHWRRAWRQGGDWEKRSLGLLVLLFAGVGGWIFYNTTVLNAYQPPGKEETAAEIERRFKQYESLPMPVVTDTEVAVEIYPDQRYFTAQGTYTLENRTDQPVEEIHLLTFINLDLGEVAYPGATLREAHPEWGYYIYDLETPLQPGEQQQMQFATRTQPQRGFRNQVDSDDVYMIYPNDVVGNGTNLHGPFILPFVGYTKMVEHKKAWLRAKLDLPPLGERMRNHDDPTGLEQGLMLTHLTWGTTDITVGTAVSQTAIAPGNLVDQWQQGDRRYFRYRSTAPSHGKFTIYSGDYAIYRDDSFQVPVEVYYHPEHDENVTLMAQQAGQALEFYEDTFGPYPFEQVRLVEFVYYDGMVFSEAGTLGIPEVIGWKSSAQGLGKENLIDWVSYLLAQSWWEDQLIAADVAGGMTIREALSAYASRLYQRSRRTREEQELAQQQLMRDFFRQLGKVDFQEPPLIDVYNELPVARHKGGMVLELIESQVGQDALLAGIRSFLAEFRYQPAPYATVLDLQNAIAAAASPEEREMIGDLFAQVVTYQVGLTDAVAVPLPDGQFRVQLELDARKILTEGLGEQANVPLDLPVTVALSNEAGEPIYQAEYQVGEQDTLELVTDERPAYAAVDPEYRLPSPFVQDNVRRVRSR